MNLVEHLVVAKFLERVVNVQLIVGLAVGYVVVAVIILEWVVNVEKQSQHLPQLQNIMQLLNKKTVILFYIKVK